MKAKRIVALGLTAILLMGAVAGCGADGKTEQTTESAAPGGAGTADDSAQTDTKEAVDDQTADGEADPWVLAATDPYTPYPDTVNYTIGVTVDPSRTYPEDNVQRRSAGYHGRYT